MSSRSKKNLYSILEIDETASPSEIRTQYKKLVLKYHPDKNSNKDEATARFREIQYAYQILSDEKKKLYYDKYGLLDEDSGDDRSFSFLPILASILIEATMSILIPCDTISKRMKFESGTNMPSFIDIVNSIRKKDGWFGFWRGTHIRIFGSILSITIENSISTYTEGFPLVPLGMSALLTYPLDVVSTCIRLGLIDGFFNGVFALISNNGIKGLFSGLKPLLFQNIVYLIGYYLLETSSLNTWMQEKVKEKGEQGKLGQAISLKTIFSLFKVAVITLLTCPFKTWVVRAQGAAIRQSNTVDQSLITIAKTEGVSRLYSGFLFDMIYLGGNRLIQTILGVLS